MLVMKTYKWETIAAIDFVKQRELYFECIGLHFFTSAICRPRPSEDIPQLWLQETARCVCSMQL